MRGLGWDGTAGQVDNMGCSLTIVAYHFGEMLARYIR